MGVQDCKSAVSESSAQGQTGHKVKLLVLAFTGSFISFIRMFMIVTSQQWQVLDHLRRVVYYVM